MNPEALNPLAPGRTVTVTMTYTVMPRLRFRRRPQPWRWVARSANGRILATSGESYVNRGDCMAAIDTVFGSSTSARLRIVGSDHQTWRWLRIGVNQ